MWLIIHIHVYKYIRLYLQNDDEKKIVGTTKIKKLNTIIYRNRQQQQKQTSVTVKFFLDTY